MTSGLWSGKSGRPNYIDKSMLWTGIATVRQKGAARSGWAGGLEVGEWGAGRRQGRWRRSVRSETKYKKRYGERTDYQE